jgi:Na+/proline symporter
MKFLLPHQFKKVGIIMAPLGFCLWICMQLHITNQFYEAINLVNLKNGDGHSSYVTANTIIAIISFFSFLAGMYFLSFSKEKVEDEMIAKIRLSSFQFAALCQLLFFIFSFAYIAFSKKEPEGDGGLLLFFLSAIFLFWILFILRFNYVVHLQHKFYKSNKA